MPWHRPCWSRRLGVKLMRLATSCGKKFCDALWLQLRRRVGFSSRNDAPSQLRGLHDVAVRTLSTPRSGHHKEGDGRCLLAAKAAYRAVWGWVSLHASCEM